MALIGERVAEFEELLSRGGDEARIKAIKRDLRYWHTRQITAELQPVPGTKVVEFGAAVTFRLNGKNRTITIVGDDEADPASGLVSFSAPLSRALMGGEAGEFLPFGNQEDAIEVLSIAVPGSG
jgi:transcription elongation GreA/GreB family factor